MMYQLLEKILRVDEVLHTGEWGFVDLSGRRITDIKNHAQYAQQYLKDRDLTIPKYEEGIIATFLRISGWVRYYIENEEVGFTVVAPVSSIQLSSLRRIGRRDRNVWFDIVDKEGDFLLSGEGFSDLTSALKNMELLEKMSHGDDYGFIDPSGGLIGNLESHERYAREYFKKRGVRVRGIAGAIVAKYLQVTKSVRYDMVEDEANFTIITSVTPAQIRAIRILSKGKGVVYDIADSQGDTIEYGEGIPSLISALKNMDLLEKVLRVDEDAAGLKSLYKIYKGQEQRSDPADLFTALTMMEKYYREYLDWYAKYAGVERNIKEFPVRQDYQKRLWEIQKALKSTDTKEQMIALDNAINQWHIDYPVIAHLGMEADEDTESGMEFINLTDDIVDMLNRIGRLPKESPYAKIYASCKNMDLLEKILQVDEARGYWRDWSELQCQNPDCRWRSYKKTVKKEEPEVLKSMKCPECGTELKLEESNFDLLEKTMRSGDAGWIDPKGKLVDAGYDHQGDAKNRLKKLTGKLYSSGLKAVRDFMKLTNYIRYTASTWAAGMSDLNVEIEGTISSSQFTRIRNLLKGYEDFNYEVRNPRTGRKDWGKGYQEFVNVVSKLGLRENVSESSIDFPREDLDLAVWNKEDDSYILKDEVKEQIIDLISKYSDKDLNDIAKEIHIVGSIGTNLFQDGADIDVHIIPENIKEWSEETVNEVRKWFNEHRDELDGYINEHPIEIYIQLDSNQDLMSDGCYNLLNDEWLVGPKIAPMDFDPYEDFSHIADDIKNEVEDADVLFGELKRDVIDYDVIHLAMGRMSGEDKERLLQKLQDKLNELEDDIEVLFAKRKDWVDKRHNAAKPATPEQALKDVELAKRWKDTNATFKFIDRYKYLKTIKDLQELLSDEEITPDEIDKIKSIMGIQ